MSRIGKKPIEVPENVTVTIAEGNFVTVKGPKGELTNTFNTDIKIEQEDNVITLIRPSESKEHRSIHGTTRSLIDNMVIGVSQGFERTLELSRCRLPCFTSRSEIVLNVGYSHPVEFTPEEGIEVEVPANTKITVRGINKERVGALASNIRQVRPPEPYKGKGIRYEGEIVRRKEGKTGK